MALFLQSATVIGPNVTQYILPGTLANGLKALYFFDRGLSGSVNNFAPGGVQGASFFGTPTINGDGTMTFTNATAYLQTPILETVEETAFCVAYSNAPLAGEVTVVWGNFGTDTTRSGSPLVGNVFKETGTHTAPDGVMLAAAYFGPAGATPPTVVNVTGLDVPAWRTPNLLWQTVGTSSETSVIGNRTTNTSVASAPQSNPHQVNGAVPFQVGNIKSSTGTGNCNVGMWGYYNRIITTAEMTALQAWINNYTSTQHGYTI